MVVSFEWRRCLACLVHFLVALAQPSLASSLAVSSGSAPGRAMIETGRQARGQECLAYLERGGWLQSVASGDQRVASETAGPDGGSRGSDQLDFCDTAS